MLSRRSKKRILYAVLSRLEWIFLWRFFGILFLFLFFFVIFFSQIQGEGVRGEVVNFPSGLVVVLCWLGFFCDGSQVGGGGGGGWVWGWGGVMVVISYAE